LTFSQRSSSLRRRAHHLHIHAVALIIFFAPPRSSSSSRRRAHHLHLCAAAPIIFTFALPRPSSSSSRRHHKRKTELERDAIEQEIVRISLTPKLNRA